MGWLTYSFRDSVHYHNELWNGLFTVHESFSENGCVKEKDILVLPLDLTDTSSHEAATKAVLQEFGKVSCISCQ